MKRSRLLLLDSHAILHRAYHAIPNLQTTKGEATGALYGIVSMLLKAVQELKPDYVVACRDLPGKTFRHDVFDAYKATRTQADDALIEQLKKAPEVFEAFGVPVYGVSGYEADDCLGTIVHDLRSRDDIDVVIATGDMDTLQLVGKNVSVFTLRKGLNDTVLYDGDRVRERYGFGPEQVIDYKGLRGDPSDNIPGIRGIGEKTATDLLIEFGTLDDLYEMIDKKESAVAKKVKPRILELLKNGRKDALFSRELATISTEAPIHFHMPEKMWRLADNAESVNAICDRFEFGSLKARIKTAIEKQEKQRANLGTESGDDAVEGHAAAALFELAPLKDDADPVELEETRIALWLLRSDYAQPTIDDVCAYADTRDFKHAREKIFLDLKATGRLQEVYDHIEKPLIPIMHMMHETGVGLDVAYLKNLAKEYKNELKKIEARIYLLAGHEFNISSPKQLGVVLFDELKISEGGKKTAGGARTTREDELQKIAELHPIIEDVLSYRELSKLLSTYIDKMPDLVGSDGRLHAKFLQAGTTTGRMASEDPNLQNIPTKTEYGRRIRSAFVAAPGRVIVALDYSQIELRIAAGLSGDKHLVSVFKDGGDIHAAVASRVFGVPPEKVDKEMRRRAKVINFGILYGMGVNALRQNLGADVSREESTEFLEGYFKSYPQLKEYVESVKESAREKGYTETLYGRRRYFAGFKSPLPGVRAQAERMAVNAPIQGTQSDIVKLAMIQAQKMLEEKGWSNPSDSTGQAKAVLVMQIHDELVYEIDEKHAVEIGNAIRDVMQNVAPIEKLHHVPILAEMAIGANWGELKKL